MNGLIHGWKIIKESGEDRNIFKLSEVLYGDDKGEIGQKQATT